MRATLTFDPVEGSMYCTGYDDQGDMIASLECVPVAILDRSFGVIPSIETFGVTDVYEVAIEFLGCFLTLVTQPVMAQLAGIPPLQYLMTIVRPDSSDLRAALVSSGFEEVGTRHDMIHYEILLQGLER